MAYSDGAIPRGLDYLGIVVLDSDDEPPIVDTNLIEVPGPRALNFTIESNSDELEGGNATIAVARDAKKVTGSVELGIMNLQALAAFTGGTAVVSGSGSNHVTTLEESSASPTQYIQIAGQAPDRRTTSAAYRVVIYKALVTSGPDESLTTGAWDTPTLDFEATENPDGNLLKRQHFETAANFTLVP